LFERDSLISIALWQDCNLQMGYFM